jgi:hemerythrin superfamily protein
MITQHHQDLIDDIVTDHREVEAVFNEIENTEDTSIRRKLVEHVITELVRHSVAEEQYRYPTTRRVLPDGEGRRSRVGRARQGRRDHEAD